MLAGPWARLTFGDWASGTDSGGSLSKADLRNLAERHGAAVGHGDEHLGRYRLRIAAIIARVPYAHGVALAPSDCCCHWLGSQRQRDQILQVANHQPVTGELCAVRIDVEIVAADHPFGVSARGSRHRSDHRFNLAGKLLHLA